VGASRSGTTLLRRIGRNKTVEFSGKLHFLEAIWPEENARPLVGRRRPRRPAQGHSYPAARLFRYASHPVESGHEGRADEMLESMSDTPICPSSCMPPSCNSCVGAKRRRDRFEHTPAYSLPPGGGSRKLYPGARMIDILSDPPGVLTSQRNRRRRRRMNPRRSSISRREPVPAWPIIVLGGQPVPLKPRFKVSRMQERAVGCWPSASRTLPRLEEDPRDLRVPGAGL
jgi:hypothetical protein